jgi:hypothetical protein
MNILLAEPSIAIRRIDLSLFDADPVTVRYSDAASRLWQTVVSCWYDEGTESDVIDSLEDGYVVLHPIPVKIRHLDDATYVASFEEANIAISGWNRQDAYQSLFAEILDTFDALVDEPQLSQHAAAQLRVLRSYLAKT